MQAQTAGSNKIGSTTSHRAEVLADRIEEGAAGLAAFAEGLSDAEWTTPVKEKVRKRRPASVGVIVHLALPVCIRSKSIWRERSRMEMPSRK